MQRRTVLVAGLGLGLGARLKARTQERHGPSASVGWHHRSLVGLGTTLRLTVGHPDPARAGAALDAAVHTLREVEASMSLFREDSEISRLNRQGELLTPSSHLQRVLREALNVAKRSHGAFDPTVQPLWLAWSRAAAEQRLPTVADRTAALARTGWSSVHLTPQRVHFSRPEMGLTLNGIGQGYAADAVTRTLKAHGMEHALLDTGEHAAWGLNDRGQPWTLGIEDPHDTRRLVGAIRLDGRAMATSADHRTPFSADHRHHHILDTRTGDSPQMLSSVTVLATSAMRADALTKVMFMASPSQIPALARQWGVGVAWVDKQGRTGHTDDVTWMNT